MTCTGWHCKDLELQHCHRSVAGQGQGVWSIKSPPKKKRHPKSSKMHLVGVGHLKNLPKDPFFFWEKDPILKAAMLEVMTFVNQIAEIVHGVVDECWGAVNKNDGHLDINRRMLQFLITELILENISQKVPFHLTMKSLIRGDSFLIIWRLADLTSADVCLPPSSHSAGLPPSFFTVTFSFNLVAALN